MNLSFKRLVLPIITGGIVAPLAMVSIFSGVVDQWVAAGLLFVGVMLAYYGFSGAFQVEVSFINSLKMTFFMDEESRMVKQFISRVNDHLYLQRNTFSHPKAFRGPQPVYSVTQAF